MALLIFLCNYVIQQYHKNAEKSRELSGVSHNFCGMRIISDSSITAGMKKIAVSGFFQSIIEYQLSIDSGQA
jgi:hypothetical protein